MKSKLLKYLCPHYWFNNKKEITFYGDYRYVDKITPICNSSEVGREWIKKAKQTFDKELLENNTHRVSSGHRCQGIDQLMDMGFIIKNDAEFAIETNGNDEDIKIHLDGGGEYSNSYSNVSNPRIEFFDKRLMGQYTKPMGANPYLLKKKTPWYLTAPKDIIFLMLPINYADDDRFMSATGIFDPVMSPQMNIVLWWFVKKGYEVVRKDVPLAQLIPIPRNKIYDSWKMIDEVPMKIHDYMKAQEYIQTSSKCTLYSQYKKLSNDIYNF